MKTPARSASVAPPSDDDVRAYAQHLYEQSGRLPGHDLENWLEARACLEACIPADACQARLHHHLEQVRHGFTMPPSDASLWIEQEDCCEPPPALGSITS